MKVLIDADGCPVVDAAIRQCKKYGLPCLLLCDTSHLFQRDGAETLVFDKGADSVDFALVNRIQPEDIVITQDYGLASMCLARKAKVLHQDGWEYTPDNMDALLLVRHDSRKLRAAGGRTKGPKKRTQAQNDAFEAALDKLLQTSVQG
ncbi:MAG: YaiI/YqxD family protein [Oscillospiraceae bacterium]|nr:YaiI/YqxD family protein [Oscillospiraceae bacterium]